MIGEETIEIKIFNDNRKIEIQYINNYKIYIQYVYNSILK